MANKLRNFDVVAALDGVTATTTSNPVDISLADKVGIQLVRGSGAGNTVWTFNASINGTNYKAIYVLDETNTAVANVTQSSEVNSVVSLPINTKYRFLTITATITTGGASSAYVAVYSNGK